MAGLRSLAEDIAAELEPADGWWNEDSAKLLADGAEILLEVMSADDALSFLSSIFAIFRAEYGE